MDCLEGDRKPSVRARSSRVTITLSSTLGLRTTRRSRRGGFFWGRLVRRYHANAGRHDRRVVWNVILVPQEQLQCVCSWFQDDFRLGLAGSKVQMIEVVGNGLIERWQLCVDQQVVMTGIRAIGAGWCDPHLAQ